MRAIKSAFSRLFRTGKPKDDTPKDEPTDTQPADEFATAVLHTCPDRVRTWPVVSGLTVERRNGQLCFDSGRRDLWAGVEATKRPDGSMLCGELHVLLRRDGKWHCGPCDGIWTLPSSKGEDSACVPDDDTRRYEPHSGETVGIVLVGCSRGGRLMKPAQRTEICWLTW